MKLYDMKLSPNCRRVRIFLAEKGLTIETEECFDAERACLKTDYISRYSPRLVPMLELDDGTQIGESTAICRYMERLHPIPALWGRTALEEAMVEMWQQKVHCDGELGVEESFRNAFPPFAGRGLPGTAETVAQIPELIERGRARYGRFVRMLDHQLERNPFVAGQQFSMPDISALCAIDFARFTGLELPSELKHVARWYEAVSKRPSAQA